MFDPELDRRTLLRALGAGVVTLGLSALGAPSALAADANAVRTRPIPSSGVRIPIVGMGTWITFNVGEDLAAREARAKVLAAFFERGGRVIDSSPMYGSSQEVLGFGLRRLGRPRDLFAADKIWTRDGDDTIEQLVESRKEWAIPRFDLMQVHNLLSWEEHLPTLLRLKSEGKIGHVGITTSHGRRHDELERLMKTQPLDFVQLTYNAADREAEQRLLPLAAERGIAVIANRPFRGGSLVDHLQRHPLPSWAAEEVGATNWPQFLLKFIVSHPAVTCAIPATTRVEHVLENMGAARGRLPDEETRVRMLRYMASL